MRLVGDLEAEAMTVHLRIPGEPRGKGRPRFVKATGRTYTDAQTMSAEQRVQGEWIAAGRPVIDGPVSMSVELVMRRPAAHLRLDGSLSALGSRSLWPTKRPDIDNVWKLCADALNGLAYPDDALIVEASVLKRWAVRDECPCTIIVLEPAGVPWTIATQGKRAA